MERTGSFSNYMSYFTAVTLKDDFGFRGEFTPVNDFRVAQPYRLAGSIFGAANDTNFWTVANSGGASAAGVAAGFATLTSGTANSGYGQISSVAQARFMFVHPHLFRAVIRVTALGVTECTRRWGAYTLTATTSPNNGFFFSFSGANVLSVNAFNTGSASIASVSSGSFNGAVASYTMDTNVHAYEIVYFEMSASFYIDGVLIHKFTPTTVKMAATLTTNAVATSINSGTGTASGLLEVWAMSILRLGREHSQPKYAYLTTAASTQLKTGAGTLHRITLNNAVGTLITVYDGVGVTANIIAIIDTPATANALTLEYGIDFLTGLYIVTTGTWNLTVVYE